MKYKLIQVISEKPINYGYTAHGIVELNFVSDKIFALFDATLTVALCFF